MSENKRVHAVLEAGSAFVARVLDAVTGAADVDAFDDKAESQAWPPLPRPLPPPPPRPPDVAVAPDGARQSSLFLEGVQRLLRELPEGLTPEDSAAVLGLIREGMLRAHVRRARSAERLHYALACPLAGCLHCRVCRLGPQPVLIHSPNVAERWKGGMCALCAKKVEAMSENEAGGRGVESGRGSGVGSCPSFPSGQPAVPETIRSSASSSPTTGTQDSAPLTPPFEPPIELSPAAPHRLRRADDFQDIRIRSEIYTRWVTAFTQDTPHAALMRALDDYKRELTLLAIRRCGAKL